MARLRARRARVALGLTLLGAGDGDLHAAAEGADVADDDLVARLEPFGDLGDARLLVDGADLHGRDLERLAVDAIDERLAVVLALTQRARRDADHVGEGAADDASRR